MLMIMQSRLATIYDLCHRISTSEGLCPEQHEYLAVVRRGVEKLQQTEALYLNLLEIAEQSHDLRQPLTGIVGYSALLNSDHFSDHTYLSATEREQIDHLYFLCCSLHWHLDSLIMFATYLRNPERYDLSTVGDIDLFGYVQSQATDEVCYQRFSSLDCQSEIPFVYANDVSVNLMVRALFVVALEVHPTARIYAQVYSLMQTVRTRLFIAGKANLLPRLDAVFERPIDALNTTFDIHGDGLLSVAAHIVAGVAERQGGHFYTDTQHDDLVLALTVPASLEG